ncbi:MAG: hypothetical protein QNL12_01570, partial [Acidimicrobiia bacterium]|nr:hypothetical protein [Acidimicrobiia bacterium]MDX2465974.1 hypothetical protein [Acidimicrobiia bacterium]
AVAGTAATFGPGILVDLAQPSLVIMIGVVVVAGGFAWHDQKVTRNEGFVLLGVFLLFTILSY